LAYREISIMDIWEIIRRWHSGQGIREIARSLGYDRKTVQRYTRLAVSLGLSRERSLSTKDEVLRLLESTETGTGGRLPQRQTIFSPYLDEIIQLVNDPELALKPKSAFWVISERHALSGKVSYSSFKRFVRTHRLQIDPNGATCRLEALPGSEVQIDYARIGLFFDPLSERRRTLHAFIGTLSHSRLKYIELTFSQDQTSFVSSHVRMFEFFGGVPGRIVLDNLKSGILKSHLYDPIFNRTYAEMAEHYGCFIDPARIRRPKDKGKVERDVQTVREAVRREIVMNPSITLRELNQAMKHWMLHEYGERAHGTTREKPLVAFTERERPALKPLPDERFEISVWKQATVHPDHYIQFRGKAFSVPHAYVTKKVWIRATEHLLQVFHQEQLIAQHVITKAYRHTTHSHFPENVRAALDTSSTHRSLLDRASRLGSDFHRLIRELLDVHAFINLRRAQGLLSRAEEIHNPTLVNRAARFMLDQNVRATPHNLLCVVEKLQLDDHQHTIPELSHDFVRDITYFIHNQEGLS
jgi:transposase